ncbi:MAG: ROK family protein [Alphaproteobacteria bacterium]|nr:ROK family protein [Alphaproteobacteria bacterium]
MMSIGLDIGGTKIAGARFAKGGIEEARAEHPTPDNYQSFLQTCRIVADELGAGPQIGVAMRGVFNRETGLVEKDSVLPYLSDVSLREDLEKVLGRKIILENDANCAALAEAIDGAGAGYKTCLGVIAGTGLGSGFVVNGEVLIGANSFCGEIGHIPLPYYEDSDGDKVPCGCGQVGCLEKLVAGPALARLYKKMVGRNCGTHQMAEDAARGDADALRVLDRYYTVFAKAMVVALHSFDPEVIIVSGGLSGLPGLYEEVPKRWGRYAMAKQPKTKFVPARYGPKAGLRGAALLVTHL